MGITEKELDVADHCRGDRRRRRKEEDTIKRRESWRSAVVEGTCRHTSTEDHLDV